jgi:hypothetical protein
MVYKELGSNPLKVNRIYTIIKYWFKLLSTDNCILRSCYRLLLENAESGRNNWVSFVRDELFKLGFAEIWNEQVSDESLLPLIYQRINDQECQKIMETITNSRKCTFYKKNLSDCFSLEYYLRKAIPRPSVFKMVQLFNSTNFKSLCKLGKFIHLANTVRNQNK